MSARRFPSFLSIRLAGGKILLILGFENVVKSAHAEGWISLSSYMFPVIFGRAHIGNTFTSEFFGLLGTERGDTSQLCCDVARQARERRGICQTFKDKGVPKGANVPLELTKVPLSFTEFCSR
ncbi:hypothetical protein EDB89DRAFT_2000237 [Lactarius sanguifluus]|nr:hypothetical protein EDB89DRAFT_2000237 [Lactarius sanguifluus]